MSDTPAEPHYRADAWPVLAPELREANMRVIRAWGAAIAEPSRDALRATASDLLAHMHEMAEAERLRDVARSAPDMPRGRIDTTWSEFQAAVARLAAMGDQPGSGTEQDHLARAGQWHAARDFQDGMRALLAEPASTRWRA